MNSTRCARPSAHAEQRGRSRFSRDSSGGLPCSSPSWAGCPTRSRRLCHSSSLPARSKSCGRCISASNESAATCRSSSNIAKPARLRLRRGARRLRLRRAGRQCWLPASSGRDAPLVPPAWETTATAFGRSVPGAGGHPFFLPIFVMATLLNYLAVIFPGPVAVELWTLAIPHIALVLWMLYCDRAMRKQRATELARYRELKTRLAVNALGRGRSLRSREWPRAFGAADRPARCACREWRRASPARRRQDRDRQSTPSCRERDRRSAPRAPERRAAAPRERERAASPARRRRAAVPANEASGPARALTAARARGRSAARAASPATSSPDRRLHQARARRYRGRRRRS